MNKITTQSENPKGLHQRYYIQKISSVFDGYDFFEQPKYKNELIDVDNNSEYFVMRLDTGGSDLKHITPCRIAIHAYADAIYQHLPELAIDLKTRYPLL